MTGKRDPLGMNPLSQSIFSKTEPAESQPKQSSNHKEETIKRKTETDFLPADVEREKITLQLPVELNEWLDAQVKASKRRTGSKILKQVFVQAGVELLKELVDFDGIDSEDALRIELEQIAARIHKP